MMQPKAISFESRALDSCNKAMDVKTCCELEKTRYPTRVLQFPISTCSGI